MTQTFDSLDQLFSSIVRPTASRPILGSSRVNRQTGYWASNHFYSRGNSCSSNSDTDNSPFLLSPIGSPLKYSPTVWSKSVHNFEVKNQRIASNVFTDDNSNDSIKSEFEANGRDVPLEPNPMKSLFKKPVPPSTPVPTYQLFNGFSYAKIKPTVGDREVYNRFRNKRRVKTQTFCSFCKNNNETPEVYNSHVVKDIDGRTTCPVLREYDCPKCRSGGGDNGHTIRYCPLNQPGVEGYTQSIIKQLKSHRSADGKKRGGF